ncbi:MAG TPA: alkaline phosphatase family protein [Kofleriaceae bacterium]|nr:alkaline phosphatase family protein [Kofleriaceae bacterium]
MRGRIAVLITIISAACGGGGGGNPDARPTADAASIDAEAPDAMACVISAPTPATLNCPSPGATSSDIEHLVVIIQENHSFDSYFGNYCTATTGSAPTCTTGPACCEAAPATEPSGASPLVLDDAENGAYDPNHTYDCNLDQINGGAMDRFVVGRSQCANPKTFAIAALNGDADPYHDLAAANAMADNYFQPVVGASSSNDMYFARGAFVFKDNSVQTMAIGMDCGFGSSNPAEYSDPTIADLLIQCGVDWSWYAGGYQVTKDAVAVDSCPTADPGCHVAFGTYPCIYDPTDNPFLYYTSLRDDPLYFKDISQFAIDVGNDQLPAVSYVKPMGFLTEHPGFQDRISEGASNTADIIATISGSPTYADNTLILLVYDEGGGYYDHVAPPPTSTVDCAPYGTRTIFMAIGPFAKTNYVSHTLMEHTSIVKFIEWNWFGGETGQLGTRDTEVNNIGDMLTGTGTAVPSN